MCEECHGNWPDCPVCGNEDETDDLEGLEPAEKFWFDENGDECEERELRMFGWDYRPKTEKR